MISPVALVECQSPSPLEIAPPLSEDEHLINEQSSIVIGDNCTKYSSENLMKIAPPRDFLVLMKLS